MPTRAEIARSLEGAWLLARGDPRGVARLDLTLEGFWRSFAAALVAAPAYAVVLVEQHAFRGWPDGLAGALAGETVAYAAGWLTFPVAAVFLTRLLGLTARYVPLVVAANWSAVLQIALYALTVLLGLLLPRELRTLLLLCATAAVLVYQWFVIRSALATTGGIAFGLVVIDVLLSMATSRAIDALLAPG